jgi:gliding motility-associated lipoprotein GldK
MKNIKWFMCALMVATLFGCGMNNDRGELTGVPGRRTWFHPQPYGTIYVPSGSIHVGANEQDIPMAQIAPNRQITITAFYMDETEITNNEYRQFVYWVQDSLFRNKLAETNPEKYFHPLPEGEEDESMRGLNWDEKIDDEDVKASEDIKNFFYNQAETYYRVKQIDVRKLIYVYDFIDQRAAAQVKRQNWKNVSRADFKKRREVEIYPDTLVFIRDYTYSYNEPMTQVYFWHPKYDDYPVVGVNWKQANAFCDWRTKYLNSFYSDILENTVTDFRLPTEYEWEYAARGGRDQTMYPWGGPYIRNAKGCALANFKPGRGEYSSDGGVYPIRVASYFPNDFGLYDMAGNLAEWTSTAYAESGNMFTHDLNPDYQYDAKDTDPETLKRKTIRGGSWKDVAYFVQNGTRSYEYQDSCNSYVGFRCVMSYIGRSNRDKQ